MSITQSIEHTYWYAEELSDDPQVYPHIDLENRHQVSWPVANLVGSQLTNGLHGPAIDVDHRAALDKTGRHFSVITPRDAAELGQRDLGVDKLFVAEFVDEVAIETIGSKCLASLRLTARGILLNSRTFNHSHLYTEHQMPPDRYQTALEGLHQLGIVQLGFLSLYKSRDNTFLRKPQNGKQLDMNFNNG